MFGHIFSHPDFLILFMGGRDLSLYMTSVSLCSFMNVTWRSVSWAMILCSKIWKYRSWRNWQSISCLHYSVQFRPLRLFHIFLINYILVYISKICMVVTCWPSCGLNSFPFTISACLVSSFVFFTSFPRFFRIIYCFFYSRYIGISNCHFSFLLQYLRP